MSTEFRSRLTIGAYLNYIPEIKLRKQSPVNKELTPEGGRGKRPPIISSYFKLTLKIPWIKTFEQDPLHDPTIAAAFRSSIDDKLLTLNTTEIQYKYLS